MEGGSLFSVSTGNQIQSDASIRDNSIEPNYQITSGTDNSILNTYAFGAASVLQRGRKDALASLLSFSTLHGEAVGFVMIPGGRSFTLYYELSSSLSTAAVESLLLIEIFANRSYATGFGEYALRAKPWGANGGLVGVPAGVSRTSRVQLAYYQDGAGAEKVIINGPDFASSFAVDLETYAVAEYPSLNPAASVDAEGAFANGGTKFVWVPEGIFHNAATYTMVSVAYSSTGIVYVYLGSADGSVETVVTTAVVAGGAATALSKTAAFTGSYTFKPDGIKGPGRSQLYATTAAALYEVSWAASTRASSRNGGDPKLFTVAVVTENDILVQNEGSSCACDEHVPVLGKVRIIPPDCADGKFSAWWNFPITITNNDPESTMNARIAATVNGASASQMLSSTVASTADVSDGSFAPIPTPWVVSIAPLATTTFRVPVSIGDTWAVDVFDLDHDDEPIAFSPRTATADASSCNIYCGSVQCTAGKALSTLAATTDLLCDSTPCSQEQCCVAAVRPPCSACAFGDRPHTIKFKLRAGGVGALSNAQGGKASVAGDGVATTSSGPFTIFCFNSESNYVAQALFGTTLELGAIYTTSGISGTSLICKITWGAGQNTFLQTVNIHTSCSHPIVVGDRFGALELYGYSSDTGVVSNPSGCSSEDPCTPGADGTAPEAAASGCTVCGDNRAKVRTTDLVLKLTTGGPSTFANTQDGKASVTGDEVTPAADGSITVKCYNSKNSLSADGYHPVVLGSSFAMSGIAGITTARCHVLWATGGQFVDIHTSCSKPFAVGDQFGALIIASATLSSGKVVTEDCVAAVPPTEGTFVARGPQSKKSDQRSRGSSVDERCENAKGGKSGTGNSKASKSKDAKKKSGKRAELHGTKKADERRKGVWIFVVVGMTLIVAVLITGVIMLQKRAGSSSVYEAIM